MQPPVPQPTRDYFVFCVLRCERGGLVTKRGVSVGHHIISHAPGSSAGYGRFNNSSFSSKLIQVPSWLDFWMWLHSWRGCSTAKGIGVEEAEKCGVRSEVGSRVPRSGSEWSERRRGRRRRSSRRQGREREVRRMRNRGPEGKAVGGPIGASP